MSDSPPRPGMPSDDLGIAQVIPQPADEARAPAQPLDAAGAFVMPPAPLPVAPWWASSTPDPTPPDSVLNAPATIVDPVPAFPAQVPPPAPVTFVPAPPPIVVEPIGIPPEPPAAFTPVPVVPDASPPSPEVLARPAPAEPIPVVGEPIRAPEMAPMAPLAPPPAPPAAPRTLVDKVLSTGPQPNIAVQALPAWQTAPGPPSPPHPAPAPRKPRTALMAVVALGVGVVAATVTTVLVAVSGGEDVPMRKVAAAGTAGGLRKGNAVPAVSAAYPFIAAAARAGGVEEAISAGGIYRDSPTGAQNILFLGGTAPIGDPAAFVQKAVPSTVLTVAKTAPGTAGGQVSCGTFAVLAETHLYCAWATENSFGFVASNVPAVAAQPSGLAPLALRMRADLEKRSS